MVRRRCADARREVRGAHFVHFLDAKFPFRDAGR